MKKQSLKSLLCAGTFTLAAALSVESLAQTMEETQVTVDAGGVATIRVPYVRSELATEEGRQQLHKRLARAAKKVCGPTSAHQAGGLRIASRNKHCYEESLEIALGQVEQNQVAASGH